MTDRVLGILAFAAFGALIIIIAVWVIWVVDAIRRGERETKKIIREWEKIEAAGGNLIPVDVRDNAKTTD